MNLDRRDLEALLAVLDRGGVDEIELRRGAEQLVLRRAPPTPPTVTLVDCVTYRWSDGDWIVAATVEVRNESAVALRLPREALRLEGDFRIWPPASTLSALAIPPNETLRGVLGWYTHSGAPQPTRATFSLSVDDFRTCAWTGALDVVLDPARSPQAPPPLPAGVRVELSAPELFRWPDGDWIVRLALRLAADAASSIPRSAFVAHLDSRTGPALPFWPPAGTMPESVQVDSGAPWTGQIAWFLGGASPRPARVHVVAGAPNARSVDQTFELPVDAS